MADWDVFSSDYDRIFFEYPVYLDTLRKIVELIGQGDDKRILDLGCGTGNAIEQMLSSFPGARITGIDPSLGMRERCQERFAGNTNVEVLEGNALDIPLEYSLYDCVISNLALHHLPPDSRGRCAGEIARVLKPRGKLIYADMFCDVEGKPEDTERARDIINKTVAAALYSLDHGAFDMAMLMLKVLPDDVLGDGEYLATIGDWTTVLEKKGLKVLSVESIEPVEIGTRVLIAERM